MPWTVDRDETCWLIRVEGDCGMTSAAELKDLLLGGLASGKELRMDLEHAGEIDISFLQLLWAAERAASESVSGFTALVSGAAGSLARNAGFEAFPGGRRGPCEGTESQAAQE